MIDYSTYVISHRPELVLEVQENLPDAIHFDGTNYPSFSKLVNSCVAQCPTEIVVICSDKVRPSILDIQEMVRLLVQDSWGLVQFYRFACFALRKELFRVVGFLDERYISGGHEDNDFIVRLVCSDIGTLQQERVPYIFAPSTWNSDKAKRHFLRKWKIDGVKVVRQLPEDIYDYSLGEATGVYMRPFKDSEFYHENFVRYQHPSLQLEF